MHKIFLFQYFLHINHIHAEKKWTLSKSTQKNSLNVEYIKCPFDRRKKQTEIDQFFEK